MAELLRAAAMRALEQAAMARGQATGLQLMERAAAATVAAALQHWPGLAAAPQRALVLCGPGNNGGDGLAIARLLAGRGWRVSVLLLGEAGRLPADAQANLDRLPPEVRLHVAPQGEGGAWLEAEIARLLAEPLPAGGGVLAPASHRSTQSRQGGSPDESAAEGSARGPALPPGANRSAGERNGGNPDLLVASGGNARGPAPLPGADRSGRDGSGDSPAAPAARGGARGSALVSAAGPSVRDRRSDGPEAPAEPGAAPALLLVDALFGTGLSRPALSVAGLLAAANAPRAGLCRLAVDLPSGICADSGRLLQPPAGGAVGFSAELTVTFHRAKPGHFLAEGAALRGALRVADIGLPAAPPPAPLRSCEAPSPAALDKAASAHKFGHGHALVLAGGPGHGGAARLAARAALRIGAGLVTLAAPPTALAENAARLDAVMLAPLPDTAALRARLADPRITALCLGPALGTARREAALLAAALAHARQSPDCRLVLDADALTLLAWPPGGANGGDGAGAEGRRERGTGRRADRGAEADGSPGRNTGADGDAGEPWLAQLAPLGANCVLTPHMGEFARLFPDLAARLAAPATRGPAFSKLDAALAAAARAGCTLLLKGPDTVIADAGGAAVLHAACGARAAPWLATAGTGDVLAGMLAGLLARGLPVLQAAEAAVWLHVEAARSFGPGLIAEDLPEELPKVFRTLGL